MPKFGPVTMLVAIDDDDDDDVGAVVSACSPGPNYPRHSFVSLVKIVSTTFDSSPLLS